MKRTHGDFSGVFTALITPFLQGKIDWASLERLVKKQLENGIHGFVINGTTAESPTLSEEERSQIFRFVRKTVGPHLPLIMGTGTNSTAETLRQTEQALALGADAALIVVPYYNRPPQRGLFQHFQTIASGVDMPIILYNVPSRTVVGLEIDTIVELSHLPGIIGIKEASGDVAFGRQVLDESAPSFLLISGDDDSFLQLAAVGGHGVISVASHILPARYVEWFRRAEEVSVAHEFQAIHNLHSCLKQEVNPIPIKMALHLQGVIASPELRLPLVALSEAKTVDLKEKMQQVGIL